MASRITPPGAYPSVTLQNASVPTVGHDPYFEVSSVHAPPDWNHPREFNNWWCCNELHLWLHFFFLQEAFLAKSPGMKWLLKISCNATQYMQFKLWNFSNCTQTSVRCQMCTLHWFTIDLNQHGWVPIDTSLSPPDQKNISAKLDFSDRKYLICWHGRVIADGLNYPSEPSCFLKGQFLMAPNQTFSCKGFYTLFNANSVNFDEW